MRWINCLWIALLSCVVLAARPALADPPATQPTASPTTEPAKYIRYVDRGDAGGELDTADVAFTNGHGVTVHLIAAVHIGEQSYYDNLNKSFAGYDAVLYELIKPRGAAPPGGAGAGERSDSMISRFQLLLKNVLDLQFQLDVIDYTKPNFVHADLDRETFDKMEADRGESIFSLMLQQTLKEWSNPTPGVAEDPDEQMKDLVKLVCMPDGRRQFKKILAQEMDQMEFDAAGLGGPDGSVIVTERNKAALRALTRSISRGKKNLAIFYGAAHMPDMSQRLEALGFTPVSTDWRTAWDLTIRANEPSFAQQMLNDMIDAVGGN
jgi:hypothetical protein